MCAQTLSLPPLPVEVAVDEPQSEAEAVVAEFAEQFSVDVSTISVAQRGKLFKALGDNLFGAVVLMYIADFIPRVRAGLEALGVGAQYLAWTHEPIAWDHTHRPVRCGVQPVPARGRRDARARPGDL